MLQMEGRLRGVGGRTEGQKRHKIEHANRHAKQAKQPRKTGKIGTQIGTQTEQNRHKIEHAKQAKSSMQNRHKTGTKQAQNRHG